MSEGSVMWRVILVPRGSTAPPDFTCREDGQEQHQRSPLHLVPERLPLYVGSD